MASPIAVIEKSRSSDGVLPCKEYFLTNYYPSSDHSSIVSTNVLVIEVFTCHYNQVCGYVLYSPQLRKLDVYVIYRDKILRDAATKILNAVVCVYQERKCKILTSCLCGEWYKHLQSSAERRERLILPVSRDFISPQYYITSKSE
jgi:hypothetical protein